MRNRLPPGLTLLAAAALPIALAAHYIRIAADHDYFYNADLLYLPSIFADLARGGDLRHWRFSNAPYLFPDIGLFLLLEALTPSSLVAIALYGVAQVLLLVGGFAWLAGRTGGGAAPALALACGAALCASLAWLGPAYPLLLVSVFHVGALVVMPYALLAAIALLEAPAGRRARPALALAALSGLTVASDLLYLLQVAVPMMLGAALLAWRSVVARGAAAALVTGVGLASAAGVAFERLTQPFRGQVTARPGVEGTLRALGELIAGLPTALRPWPWLGLAALAFILLASAALLAGLRSPEHGRRAGAGRMLALSTALGGFAIAIAVALLAGLPTDRYYLNVLYIAPFLGWALLVPPGLRPTPGRALAAATALIASAALVTSAPALRGAGSLAAYAEHYPPLVACLDANAERYGLRAGLAQYWQARPIMQFSRRGLHAAQLDPLLRPWHWLNSLGWYNHDFDFAVVDSSPLGRQYGFTERALVDKFGPPATRFSCGDSAVYVYNRPSDYRFRSYTRLAMLQLQATGNAVQIPPAALAGPDRRTAGETVEAAAGERGYLILSDPISLQAGSYTLRLRYRSDAPGEGGFMELSASGRAGEVELTNAIPLHSGRRATAVQFSLDESAPITIQLFSGGQGNLAIDQIILTRLN